MRYFSLFIISLVLLLSIIYSGFNNMSSVISILLVIVTIFIFYKNNKVSFFIMLQFIIGFLWCVASLYYIELGNYISEQKVYGENIGSLVRYVFYSLIFFLGGYLITNRLSAKVIRKDIIAIKEDYLSIFNNFIFLFYIFILLLVIIIIAKYGVPILSGMARFEFYKLIGPFDKVIFLMPILAFLLGIKNAIKYRKVNSFLFLSLILFLILFSDKFSGIFSVIIYYIIGFYISKNIFNSRYDIGFNKKIIFFYMPIAFMLLLSTVIIGFLYLQGADSVNIQEKILSRALGLQAHVWFGIDNQMITNTIKSDLNIFLLDSNEPVQPAGLEYLMYQVADYDFVRSFRDAGIRFTNGYPAIVLISFGYFYSVFVLFIFGCILGVFFSYIILKIKLLQPVRLLISLIFYNNIIVNIFIMGEIYYIYKPLGWLCFSVIIVDCIILKHKQVNFKLSKL